MNLVIMQGDEYPIKFTAKDATGTIIDSSMVADMEFVIGKVLRKTYGNSEITYDSTNSKWQIPVTQEETFALKQSDSNELKIRIKFSTGDIIGKNLGRVHIVDASGCEEFEDD